MNYLDNCLTVLWICPDKWYVVGNCIISKNKKSIEIRPLLSFVRYNNSLLNWFLWFSTSLRFLDKELHAIGATTENVCTFECYVCTQMYFWMLCLYPDVLLNVMFVPRCTFESSTFANKNITVRCWSQSSSI